MVNLVLTPFFCSITRQDKVRSNGVLLRAGIPSLFTLLRQHHLRWLSHAHKVDDRRIPKGLLYGELATGARCRGRPHLSFKNVCKRDMKACNIDNASCEALADNRTPWKQQVSQGLKRGESAIRDKNDERGPQEKPVTSRTTKFHNRHLSSCVRAAAKIANLGLASTTTQYDAHHYYIEVTTDGCQQCTTMKLVRSLGCSFHGVFGLGTQARFRVH